jgi:hypothetical protein
MNGFFPLYTIVILGYDYKNSKYVSQSYGNFKPNGKIETVQFTMDDKNISVDKVMES